MSDIPGDDVPEYPEGEGDRDEYLHTPKHQNIETIDEEQLDEL